MAGQTIGRESDEEIRPFTKFTLGTKAAAAAASKAAAERKRALAH